MSSTTTLDVPFLHSIHQPTAVFALAAAFYDDPVFTWIDPDPATRAGWVPKFFEVATPLFVSRRVSRLIGFGAGAALWLPPGEQLIADDELEAVGSRLADDAGAGAARLLTCMEILEEHHPTEPHWYLGFLGVVPMRQGLGLGGAMLRATLEGCDDAGEPAYLEATSEHNRRVYERHGFRVIGELPMPDGPSLYAMWREPVV
jgi:GNAT superfamily N-acetyltransferase